MPTRLVAARHDACGAETRARIPRAVPARAVRRLVCQRCAVPFEAEVADAAPAPRRRPRLPEPGAAAWRWAGVPLAAVAVVAAVSLLNGGSSEPAQKHAPPSAAVEVATAADAAGEPDREASGDGATLVRTSTFTLALPAGWKRTKPAGDAAFSARAPGGAADATLWVERDPDLSFAEFEARSIAQVQSLIGRAPRVERTPGPTPERSSFTLIAPAPEGAPRYVVTGRLAGPYRYYLATTVQADAPAEVAAGAELIRESFVPEGGR
ncbi:MAG TPA: hypothetical protein VIL04_00150 [Solirubrobacterales bacterium]